MANQEAHTKYYVEEALPRITRKWGYEQFPFSSTEGQSFSLVRKA